MAKIRIRERKRRSIEPRGVVKKNERELVHLMIAESVSQRDDLRKTIEIKINEGVPLSQRDSLVRKIRNGKVFGKGTSIP